MSKQTTELKSLSYWIITIVFWATIVFLVMMAIYSLLTGDIGGFIGFLLFAACIPIATLQPKWFQRFTAWFRDVRE